MSMPHRFPTIYLLELPTVAGFFTFTPDPKQQLTYNSAKLFTKLTTQNKHLAKWIYEICWGDFTTICKNFKK